MCTAKRSLHRERCDPLAAFRVAALPALLALLIGNAWAQEMDFTSPQATEEVDAGERYKNAHDSLAAAISLRDHPESRPYQVREALRNAAASLAAFAEEFPKHSAAPKARLDQAFALNAAQDFRQAAIVCSQLRDTPREHTLREEAAICAVHSWRDHTDQLVEQRRIAAHPPNANDSSNKTPPPDDVRRLMESMEYFALPSARFTPDPEVRARVIYHGAALRSRYGHTQSAKRLFLAVFDYRPALDVAKAAAHGLLQPLQAGERWNAYTDVMDRLQIATLASPEQTAQFAKYLAKSSRYGSAKQAYDALDGKRWSDAARLFLALESTAAAATADTMLFNAAYATEQQGAHDEAARLYERLAKKYRKSKHRADAVLTAANLWLKSGQRSRAVERYTEFVRLSPRHKHARNARIHAARLLEEDNQLKRAVELLEDQISLGLAPGDRDLVRKAADLNEKLGKSKRALRHYETLLKSYQGELGHALFVEVSVRAALLCEGTGNKRRAKELFWSADERAVREEIDSPWATRAAARLQD